VSLVVALAVVVATGFVHRRLLGYFGDGVLQHLVRLPGNLLHELSHAVAMWMTGYSVVGFRVSLFDPAGRGEVRPGPPWVAIARPWLTNLISPVAPTIVGLAVLFLLHRWSGAPGVPASLAAVGPVLGAVDWTRWQLWTGLALGYSVAAELAPSRIDLAAWWRPALVAAGLAVAVGWGGEHLRPGAVIGPLLALDGAARGPTWAAAAMAAAGAVAVAPIAFVAGWFRR
jgi:hypothetical protein